MLLLKVPLFNRIKERIYFEVLAKKLFVQPGHYYSPIVSRSELKKRENAIWPERPSKLVPGIDLNEKEQLGLLEDLAKYYKDIPFQDKPMEGLRYYFLNKLYTYSDAIFLYTILRHFVPKRIIEVGSGYSSAIMLDTNNLHFNNEMACTFIEPYTNRLRSLLKEEDSQVNIIETVVQDVDLEVFDKLEKDDVLFIDSTHVSKAGSDVNYLYFEVLPRLKKGVKVHIHDIFFPFEYPKEWNLKDARSWNEDYILRSFLMFNTKFKIILFNTYLEHFHEHWFKANMPDCLKNRGGSIWLEVL